MISLGVFALNSKAVLPSYGTSMSSCFDLGFYPTKDFVDGYDSMNNPVLRPILHGNVTIFSGDRLLIPTGLVFKLREDHSVETFADITREKEELRQFSIRVHPRSGLSLKKGLVLANSEGVIDVDYQQEVFVMLTNISNTVTNINIGDRIAQGEVVVNELVSIIQLKEHPTQYSERSGGFGSTGLSSYVSYTSSTGISEIVPADAEITINSFDGNGNYILDADQIKTATINNTSTWIHGNLLDEI